ncbi:hypothetical protein ABT301_12865 [Streptomyces sp. NPDC000987]|uniref:hypothetical protein n=1 Tax=Streptomyces sp. NPDC000987 TaxID=3154374 RepID=UPI0033322811
MTTALHVPRTLDEALDRLADGMLAPLAGGTWVMRTPLRGEPWAAGCAAVAGLPELRTRDSGPANSGSAPDSPTPRRPVRHRAPATCAPCTRPPHTPRTPGCGNAPPWAAT